MKILERKELSVIGVCPHCGSKLELEKGDIWWHKDIDGGKDPCVTCAACGKGFSVEGWKNISKLYISPELAESEDARMKESIIATIHLYYGEPLEDEAKKMIAWLENKDEQKSSWSEEDEEMLNQVIEDIVKLAGPHVCYHKDVDWLKSLRPHSQWKPSEEQLEALDTAIRCDIQIGTWEEDSLRSLKKQLKKLREE